jgi:hypothetical protein
MEGTGQTSCPSQCSTAQWCDTARGGEGYPCCDQIGRGKNQGTEPVYIWNNIDQNNAAVPVAVNENATSYIQINRDYYLSRKPGYAAYTYPHPLVGGSNPDPAAPSNLRILN